MDDRNNKNQRTGLIIVSVLLLLSIIGNVVLLVRNGRLSEERDLALAQTGMTTTQLEQQSRQVDTLQTTLQALRSEKAELETQLNSEIESRDSRLQQVNRRVAGMQKQVDSLRVQNQDMEQKYLALESDYQNAQQELETTRNQLLAQQQTGQTLADSIALVRPLNAYNIYPLNKWDRWLWADRYNVDRARRVDETHVAFEVAGTVFSPAGNREVHLVMRNPNGEIINSAGQEFENQETGTSMAYTRQAQVNFSSDPIPVNFVVEHETRLEPGVYQLDVFIDGRLARSSTMNLE